MTFPKGRFVERSRALRLNSTDAERRLWALLRDRRFESHKFVRQFQIGSYFADFACRELALVIELDGGQHSESRTDVRRTAYLNAQGYSVLGFWNNDVLQNADGTLEVISIIIAGHHPSPGWRYSPADLSPEGRGAKGATAALNSAIGRSSPLPSGERSASTRERAGRVRGEPRGDTAEEDGAR